MCLIARDKSIPSALCWFDVDTYDGNREIVCFVPWSRGIAFCADVRHAHDLARVLNDHNITAMAVDGGMNKKVGSC